MTDEITICGCCGDEFTSEFAQTKGDVFQFVTGKWWCCPNCCEEAREAVAND